MCGAYYLLSSNFFNFLCYDYVYVPPGTHTASIEHKWYLWAIPIVFTCFVFNSDYYVRKRK